MRRVLLLPIGSSGDVNPFLWIGRLLHAQGHEVSVVANPVFGETIRALGLHHLSFGDEAEFHALLDHPDVWHPTKGPPLVLRFAGDVTMRYFEMVAKEAQGEIPLVLAPATAFGARLAREKFGFPLITVNLQPCVFLTINDTSLFGQGFEWVRQLPAPLKRAFFSVARARINTEISPGIRRACRAVGMRPPANAFRDWWQSPDGSLSLWPEWFAAPQSDWPPGASCVGFPLYDLADQIPLSTKLQAFLATGDPPILFTPGTAMTQGAHFFATALAACRSASRRAIFATKFPDQLPADLSPDIFHVTYAPFSRLLPRCSAIVHHGGIGTTSQALAAGIPQLIMPMSHDQPDNASRVHRLGVGDWLWQRDFTSPNLGQKLAFLFGNPTLRDRCTALATRIRSHNADAQLLKALEPLLVALPDPKPAPPGMREL